MNFVHQHSNSGWNFENDDIFPPYNGLKLIIWCITFYYCTLWIPCWLSNAFSSQNSKQFTLFKEKMIGRILGSQRGRFPLLGGRWMFRREMGLKRECLPPKEETWHVCSEEVPHTNHFQYLSVCPSIRHALLLLEPHACRGTPLTKKTVWDIYVKIMCEI